MDSYGLLAVLALALGLALLVAEVFIPSGGVIAAAAALTFVISIWGAWQAWFKTDQMEVFIGFCVALLLMLPSVLGGAIYTLPRTEYGKRLMNPPSREELEPFVAETERLSQLVGASGIAITKMVPGGIVQIDGERLHAETEGMLLDVGTPVKVLALKGNRLLVREVREPTMTDIETTSNEQEPESERTPLDDEFAQS